MYRLKGKEPDFQCCDGPFEGRKFVTGQMYTDIPPEEAHKFEEVIEAADTSVRSLKKSKEVTDA